MRESLYVYLTLVLSAPPLPCLLRVSTWYLTLCAYRTVPTPLTHYCPIVPLNYTTTTPRSSLPCNFNLQRTDWAGAAVEAVRQMAALVERLSQDPHMRDRCLAAAVALRNGALSAKDSAKFNELLMRRVTALETEIALATHQAGAHGNVDTADFCSPAVISEALFWAQAARVCALAPLSREDDPVLLDITAGDAAAWGARMVALGDAVTPKRLSALQRAATQAAGATQAGGGAGGGVDESEFE